MTTITSLDLLCIVGPTASGKTSLAVHLAYQLKGEIISADSRQVYEGLDLGTGKDLESYHVNGTPVPYHLINCRQAGEMYDVFHFQQDALATMTQIKENGHLPIVCGGTGFYLDAILGQKQYVPVPENTQLRANLASTSHQDLIEQLKTLKPLHNSTDLDTRERTLRAIEIITHEQTQPPPAPLPKRQSHIIGLHWPTDTLRQRIKTRLHQRLQDGMLDEVQTLLQKGVSEEWLLKLGLEYKWMMQHLQGKISIDEMTQGLFQAICKYAKRQRSWFRRMEKQGIEIHWIEGELALEKQIAHVINNLT